MCGEKQAILEITLGVQDGCTQRLRHEKIPMTPIVQIQKVKRPKLTCKSQKRILYFINNSSQGNHCNDGVYQLTLRNAGAKTSNLPQ